MKVIAINGSSRKNKNSKEMLNNAVLGAQSVGAEVEVIDLADLDYTGCRSCFACKMVGGKSFGRCIVNDGLKDVLDKVLSADAVIIATPIYFADVPGRVRNLFERLWFPGLMYRKDGTIAYDKKVKVGLIYTMNLPDASGYQQMIGQHKAYFERFLGETEVIYALDTLQFDDYSKYVGDVFSEEHKKAHKEAQFPLDCKQAYELGAKLGKE